MDIPSPAVSTSRGEGLALLGCLSFMEWFFFFFFLFPFLLHYYKNVDLSQLGNPCCPGFPTGNASPGQKGCLFVPGLATGTKQDLLSRLVTPTGTKGAASAHVAGAPLPTGIKGPFFMFSFSQFFFYFNYTFAFQLNLCIGIQCVWSPLIYTYIYIVTYIICIYISIHVNSFTYENV